MALKDAFQKLVNRIPAAIQFVGLQMTNLAVSRMKQRAPTKEIESAISVDKVERDSAGIIVGTIKIDLKKAPEARAYEFGSGIHTEKEGFEKKKYLITPKKLTTAQIDAGGKQKKYLAFQWDKANPNIPKLKDGRVLLKSVMHPGVAAKPYIQPSIDELKRGIKKVISERIRLELGIAFDEAQDK